MSNDPRAFTPARGAPGPNHILVVDDDTTVLQFVARALSGYRVSLARDGHEALAILRADPVDFLITDYWCPR